jgi:hypothetical protein
MRTADLIRALEADAGDDAPSPLNRTLLKGLVPAIILSVALYAVTLGPRPHLASMMMEPRVLFKIVFPLVLACCAGGMLLRLIRPGSDVRPYFAFLGFLGVVLIGAVVAELFAIPRDLWEPRLLGTHATICLRMIPMFAAAPLVALLIVARKGAPTHAGLAGATIGLFAAAIGGAIYATHCPDDSPLFVATWYSLAIGAVTLVGALAGKRILRW